MSSRQEPGTPASSAEADLQARQKGGAALGQRRVWLMGGAVIVSIIGSLVHNAREFGLAAVLASANGELPVVMLWVSLFVLWWRVVGARRLAAGALLAFALLHLIGGAVVTVIPFDFLPFVPEQSWEHYLSHAIYGVAQLPLIILGFQETMSRGSSQSRLASP